MLGLPPGRKIPSQAVPTSVVRGQDGAYYVGTLTGFPFAPGSARVFRVVPGRALIRVGRDGARKVVASDGLTAPAGLAIKGRSAYVSNCGTCAGTGPVVRVPL